MVDQNQFFLGRNIQEWKNIFDNASENDDENLLVEARLNYYACCYCGLGVIQQNVQQATKVITAKGRGQNHELVIGVCYFGGYGIQADYKKAFEIFTKWCDPNLQGQTPNILSHARLELGLCYNYGWGVKKDQQKAKQIFQLAQHPFADRMLNQGSLY